jgi:hypothetical protein
MCEWRGSASSTPFEALMPEGHFERLRLGGLVGCWAVLFFCAKDPAARSPDHTMARQPRSYGGSLRGAPV